MGLIGDNDLVGLISAYRLVWISGRFGGGKTSIAYMLAERFLDKGYRLVTNNMSIWADDIKNVNLCEKHNQLHAVVILDEGGLDFKSSRQIEMVASYCRKMDVVYIIPSRFPPANVARSLTVQPLFTFKSAGIPLILYKWSVRMGGINESGVFGWWYPNYIYGVYSSNDPGDRGSTIMEWAIEKTEEYRLRWGRIDKLSELEIEDGQNSFSDAVDQLQEISADWSSIFKRGRRRR